MEVYMNTKLTRALVGALFLAFQNGFAEENLDQSNNKDGPFLDNNVKAVEEENLFNNKYSYSPYLQLGGYRFFNVNTAKAAAGGDVFVPLWQQPSQLIFTHLRFFDRTGKPFEGNAHVGYRHLVPEKDHLYGIYGAFDRKRSEFGNYFNQLTLGVEGWFRGLFVGGNFYQPIGSTGKLISTTGVTGELDRVQNNVWITRNKLYEKAMGGGDAEIGYELVKGLVGYVGGYYFNAKDTPSISGPKARVTYDWSLDSGKRVFGVFDKFGLEAGVQKDNVRGTTCYLGANIRVGLLPNYGSNLQGAARHMVDLVRRDVDIVSSPSVVAERSIFINEYGIPIKAIVLGGDQSGQVNITDFQNALASDAQVISIQGNVNGVTGEILRSINGDKIFVLDKQLVLSLSDGYQVTVDVGLPSQPSVGSISGNVEAMRILSGVESFGVEDTPVVDSKDKAASSFVGDITSKPDNSSGSDAINNAGSGPSVVTTDRSAIEPIVISEGDSTSQPSIASRSVKRRGVDLEPVPQEVHSAPPVRHVAAPTVRLRGANIMFKNNQGSMQHFDRSKLTVEKTVEALPALNDYDVFLGKMHNHGKGEKPSVIQPEEVKVEIKPEEIEAAAVIPEAIKVEVMPEEVKAEIKPEETKVAAVIPEAIKAEVKLEEVKAEIKPEEAKVAAVIPEVINIEVEPEEVKVEIKPEEAKSDQVVETSFWHKLFAMSAFPRAAKAEVAKVEIVPGVEKQGSMIGDAAKKAGEYLVSSTAFPRTEKAKVEAASVVEEQSSMIGYVAKKAGEYIASSTAFPRTVKDADGSTIGDVVSTIASTVASSAAFPRTEKDKDVSGAEKQEGGSGLLGAAKSVGNYLVSSMAFPRTAKTEVAKVEVVPGVEEQGSMIGDVAKKAGEYIASSTAFPRTVKDADGSTIGDVVSTIASTVASSAAFPRTEKAKVEVVPGVEEQGSMIGDVAKKAGEYIASSAAFPRTVKDADGSTIGDVVSTIASTVVSSTAFPRTEGKSDASEEVKQEDSSDASGIASTVKSFIASSTAFPRTSDDDTAFGAWDYVGRFVGTVADAASSPGVRWGKLFAARNSSPLEIAGS